MGRRRFVRTSLAGLAACLAAFAGAPGAATKPDAGPSTAVTRWIAAEVDAIAAARTNPPRAARALAILSTALHQAAALRHGRDPAVLDGAGAAVLEHLFPGAARPVGATTSGPAYEQGRRIGEQAVARAQEDGSDASWTGSVPVGDGLWAPTPPAFVATPLEPLAGTWRPWNLREGSQFRPGPPPAYGSARFLAELEEVVAVSESLTQEQRDIATFWADGAGTDTPPGHWNRIAIALAEDAGWSTVETARAFAALNTAQADAFIACWDAKFTYWSLRPVTAVRRLVDPNWLPFVTTPPFPSYVSGHSTTSAAASAVLGALLPDHAAGLAALADEAAMSRLFGGIHFASDNEAGLELGRRVGAVAVDAYHLDARPAR